MRLGESRGEYRILTFLFWRRNFLRSFDLRGSALSVFAATPPECFCTSFRYRMKEDVSNLSYVRKNCLPSLASDS